MVPSLIMGERFTRQQPFLKAVLAEANQHRRNQLLRLANADQINAISELALNTLRGVVPHSRDTVRLLRPYKDALRQLSQRRRSVKSRKNLMMTQSGGNLERTQSLFQTLLSWLTWLVCLWSNRVRFWP